MAIDLLDQVQLLAPAAPRPSAPVPERSISRTPVATIATGDEQRRDRVEGGLAGDLDEDEPDEDGDRRQRIGSEVGGIALERRRLELLARR